MEVAPHARRRKACDLCVTKRIKCDALKPRCSNCVLYGVDCHITAANKGSASSRSKAIEARRSTQPSDESSRVAAVEARLSGVETRLQELEIQPAAQITDLTSASFDAGQAHASLSATGYGGTVELGNSTEPLFFPSLYDQNQAEVIVQTQHLQLPPLAEISTVIDEYFQDFNAVVPLFHEPSFKRMLYCWYSPSSQRREAEWAAINVVLALNYRLLKDLPIEHSKVAQCVRNVQHVLTDLLLRSSDLLGLQTLLGLVIVYQGAKDSRLANVLIGSAVRLAHSMRLNRREADEFLSPDIVQQRKRLFWIAYSLDKSISLRWKMPSSQPDNNIHVDLPPASPEDGFGNVCTLDGMAVLNHLRTRAQLAHIQGQVYDCLCTPEARMMPLLESSKVAHRLNIMLRNWHSSIPPEFQVGAIASSMARGHLFHIATLHLMYLECWLIVHGIYPSNADCMMRITQYSRGRIDQSTTPSQLPPQSETWLECVDQCRACLKLSLLSEVTEYAMWLNVFPWMSCLIVLYAQMIQKPDHPFVNEDRDITAKSMEVYTRVVKPSTPQEQRVYAAIQHLSYQAQEAVDPSENRVSVGFMASMPGENMQLSDTLENWSAYASHQPRTEL